MEPRIGIIVCGFSENRQFVTNPYIQSVRYARGLPLVLPIVRSDHILEEYVRLCDGFLFCGGEDITPLLFGEEPKNGNGSTDITVDLFQIRLMKQILASRKPVLAICRGMQVLSVACGGSIWQDISLIPARTLDHMQKTKNRSDVKPPHLHGTGKPSAEIRGVSPVCKQFPSPGGQLPGEKCDRFRPRPGRNHRRD